MKLKQSAVMAAVLSIAVLLGTSGCASNKIDMSSVSEVIDVRSAAEYQAGHLQGAVNIDVEQSDFATNVSTLDKSAKYVLYCHSGRRAGIALQQMTDLGFTDLINAGGIDEASAATGLPIGQ